MIKEIKLPEISEDADSGIIAEIMVKEGDQVEEEQPLVAVESDKATVEVPSEFAGTVKEIKVSEDDEVTTGSVLMTLEVSDDDESEQEDETEDTDEESTDQQKSEKDEEDEDQNEKEKEKGKEQVEAESDKKEQKQKSSRKSGDKSDKEIAAAPLARRLARELDIDLSQLQQELDEERITSKDVMEYVKSLLESGQKQDVGGSQRMDDEIKLPDFEQWGEVERKKLRNIRRVTAENTRKSWRNIPHVTHFEDVEVTELENYRAKLKEEEDISVSITAIVVKMVGEALQRFPKFNSSLDLRNQELIYKNYYNVSMATDTPEGLLMPVIRDVNKKGLLAIQDELKDFVKRAADGKIEGEEMKGGNIAISNLGTIGGKNFTPVIFPPQVAILGMSSIYTKPAYDEDIEEFVPISVLPLGLSYDHRAIDGADAARFTNWLKEALENPVSVFLDS